jgi:arylsulfatase A-like enzyme
MNVILVVLDSLRLDHVGCYGNTRIRTPNLDAFAKENILFERAAPESLPTIQVRRAIMTGNRLFPFRDWKPTLGDNVISPGWAPLRESDITLSEILSDADYRTAFVTDTYHMFKPSMNFHRGFDEWRWIRGQEYDRYRSAPPPKGIDIEHLIDPKLYGTYPHAKVLQYLSNTSFRKGEEDYFGPMVFTEGMRWIEENHEGAEKFFLWLDAFDPHEPWDPPLEYREMYDPGYEGREFIVGKAGNPLEYMTERELKHTRALYAGEVTMVDKWFGKFIAKVKDLGLYENTMIIVVSDHGHQLGEHGIIHKIASALYHTLMDIVLLIHHPEGIGAGKRVREFVYHHDIFSTILSFAGIKPPEEVDGEDMWPLVIGGGGPKREYVTCGMERYVWVKDNCFAYISETDGTNPRLFDLEKDPGQFNDIAPDHPDIVKQMFEKAVESGGGPLPKFDYLPSYLASATYSTPLTRKKMETERA